MLSQVWRHIFYGLLAIMLFTFCLTSSVFAEKKVEWEKSLEIGLAKAKKAGKPMIVDFYADW